MSANDFLKLSDEQVAKLGRFFEPRHYCASPNCGKQVRHDQLKMRVETPRGIRYFHEDCYYRDFSEEIDKHPIFTPGIRRG
jgi:hypothetical protein